MAILGRRSVGPLAVVLILVCAQLSAQPAGIGEDDIKAAFLYNFAKYINWPESAFPSGAFRLCVVANTSFEQRIDSIVAGESIAGRSVMRVTPQNADAARTCHILFMSRSEVARAGDLMTAVAGLPVLTVGETPNFLTRGGTVLFVNEGGRVRFDVNVDAADRASLTISSRLLRVARHVLMAPEGRRR